MPCSYKQRCTDGFRCAWRLSCSPWTWIFVSIAEMVALPCVSVTLCEHIIMLMHYVFGKLHFKSCLVTFVMWWVVLNQVSTQICNVQIFGEVVYYFTTSTNISMASLASFQMVSCSFLWLLQSVDLVITTHWSSLASMTFFFPQHQLLSVLACQYWKWLVLWSRSGLASWTSRNKMWLLFENFMIIFAGESSQGMIPLVI